jgi:HAD superfamily hydrolase (TIGR01509 family)
LASPWNWEYYRQYGVGVDDREMLRMVAARSDPPRKWEELWALYPAKKKLFQARMAQSPPFDPSLDGFLGGLHGVYKLAVVSSSSTTEIAPILAAGGIRRHFDTLVCGEDVQHHKPAPDPYLLAAQRLGVRTALVVEDSEPGMASGRAAGFEVLAVKGPPISANVCSASNAGILSPVGPARTRRRQDRRATQVA